MQNRTDEDLPITNCFVPPGPSNISSLQALELMYTVRQFTNKILSPTIGFFIKPVADIIPAMTMLNWSSSTLVVTLIVMLAKKFLPGASVPLSNDL